MKAILMSIHPKWCEKIFDGEKTIEIRKTVPKLETPFKVYVYMTKRKWIFKFLPFLKNRFAKVIGSFVCDRIDEYAYATIACAKFEVNGAEVAEHKRYNAGACLTAEEMFEYSNGRSLCGWHIFEPKLFDKPRELSEFKKEGFMSEEEWLYALYPNTHCHYEEWAKKFTITRPPQSWCYVEEEK